MKHLSSELRGLVALDWISGTFAAATLNEAADEIDRLEKLVYVPGLLKCAKCGFALIKTNLHVQTGNFSTNNEPDHCPNDGAPLWRVTERDAGNEMVDRGAEMSDQIIKLRAALHEIADLDKHGGYNSACHRARAAIDPNKST